MRGVGSGIWKGGAGEGDGAEEGRGKEKEGRHDPPPFPPRLPCSFFFALSTPFGLIIMYTFIAERKYHPKL